MKKCALTYSVIKETHRQFDEEFIKLARSVYYENDDRAKVKKAINLLTGSELVEEKSYESYEWLQKVEQLVIQHERKI